MKRAHKYLDIPGKFLSRMRGHFPIRKPHLVNAHWQVTPLQASKLTGKVPSLAPHERRDRKALYRPSGPTSRSDTWQVALRRSRTRSLQQSRS